MSPFVVDNYGLGQQVTLCQVLRYSYQLGGVGELFNLDAASVLVLKWA
jgi:hypothetical protein